MDTRSQKPENDIFQNILDDAIVVTNEKEIILNFYNLDTAKRYHSRITKEILHKKQSHQLSLMSDVECVAYNKNICYQFVVERQLIPVLTKIHKLHVIYDLPQYISLFVTHITNKNYSEITNFLTANPALKNFPLINGEKAIHLAVRKNSLDLLTFLVEVCQVDINTKEAMDGSIFRGMTPIFLAASTDIDLKILDYLLSRGADPAIPTLNGRTPLASAVYFGKMDKIKCLIAHGKDLNVNLTMDNGHTALINAVEKGNEEAVSLILSIRELDVNAKRENGESALFIAAKNGHLNIVKSLLSISYIDPRSYRSSDNQNAFDVANQNQHVEIANLIKNADDKVINEFVIHQTEIENHYPYDVFLSTQRKTPSPSVYWQYIRETSIASAQKRHITLSEEVQVRARKLWSDVYSETYQVNQNLSIARNIKNLVLNRLKQYQNVNAEELYHRCISYIVDDSSIVMTFDAKFLHQGLFFFSPLNMWEKDNRNTPGYTNNRNVTELGLFNFLSDNLKKEFFKNIHALPRYATLRLIDRNHHIGKSANYGSSFIVFKEVVKWNSLFSAGDTLDHRLSENEDYQCCTLHNVEFLLLQCSKKTLDAIVSRVINGSFPDTYSQDKWSEKDGGYLEALVPAVSLFDPHLVEHIHIDSTHYTMSSHDMKRIEDAGIRITNQPQTPYADLDYLFMMAISKDDVNDVAKMINDHPSLAHASNAKGLGVVHWAAKNGSLKVLNLFVTLDLNFISCTPGGFNVLHFAAAKGKVAAIKIIVDHIAKKTGLSIVDILNKTQGDGRTALHIASRNGHADAVTCLLALGANINAQINDGRTALHLAIKHKKLSVTEILIYQGAKASIKCAASKTAFDEGEEFLLKLSLIQPINSAISHDNVKDLCIAIKEQPEFFSALIFCESTKQKLLEKVCANNSNNDIFILFQNHWIEIDDLCVKKNGNGKSAFQVICESGNVERLKLILGQLTISLTSNLVKHTLNEMIDTNQQLDNEIIHLIAKTRLLIYIEKKLDNPHKHAGSTIPLFGIKLKHSTEDKLNAAIALNEVDEGIKDKKGLKKYKSMFGESKRLGKIHHAIMPKRP